MKKTKPFKRSENGKYYFRYIDRNGNRNQKCLDTYDYKEAVARMEALIRKLKEPPVPSFLEELKKYQTVETNPRYRDAQISGDHYSLRYARTVSFKAKQLEEICLKHSYELCGLKLNEFTRRDVKKLTESIIAEVGHCRTAQILQQVMKGVFNAAWQDGIIETSPAMEMRRIRYDAEQKRALPNEWIAWCISRPELFVNPEFWAYFTIAATTGMRRSEILALSYKQITDGVMIINRNLLDVKMDSPIGLPKWGIIRSIPLSKITIDAIESLSPHIGGRYFYHPSSWVDKQFSDLKATLNGCDPEHKYIWEDMTSHLLRHSFNTNMIVGGADSNLVAEYLGWKHQNSLLDMQQRYTHFTTKHLRSVSQKVDELYSFKEKLLEAL